MIGGGRVILPHLKKWVKVSYKMGAIWLILNYFLQSQTALKSRSAVGVSLPSHPAPFSPVSADQMSRAWIRSSHVHSVRQTEAQGSGRDRDSWAVQAIASFAGLEQHKEKHLCPISTECPMLGRPIGWGEDDFAFVFNVLFTEDSPGKENYTHLPLSTSSLSCSLLSLDSHPHSSNSKSHGVCFLSHTAEVSF